MTTLLATNPVATGRGTLAGRTAYEGRPVHIPDVLADPEYTYAEGQRVAGYRSMLGVPLLRDGTSVGVVILVRKVARPFTEKQMKLVTTFADQAVIAIETVRLFDEIQEKSRQLAEASQHKSQFLANMSHELRTPLNAILGYTELLIDKVYDGTPEKMQDVLQRIDSNGRHLLGLINDVLDLSKIEAGQLTLALSDYALKNIVHTVFSALEPLAKGKQIAFKADVPPDLPPGYGDERRLTQVVLNLVGNAIKFTDVGEVVVKAAKENGSPCVIPARAFAKAIEPSFSRSSSKPTMRSRAKREVPAWGSQSRNESSNCTEERSGSSQLWDMVRHSPSRFRPPWNSFAPPADLDNRISGTYRTTVHCPPAVVGRPLAPRANQFLQIRLGQSTWESPRFNPTGKCSSRNDSARLRPARG
jgi:hypothetical protein